LHSHEISSFLKEKYRLEKEREITLSPIIPSKAAKCFIGLKNILSTYRLPQALDRTQKPRRFKKLSFSVFATNCEKKA